MVGLLERSRNAGLFSLVILLCLTALLATPESDDPNIVFNEALFKAMKYRHIGPFRGGRVTAVTGIPDDIFTYYMGATGGGVWKTTDAGQSWKNVSDGHFNVGSIGAIAVSESDPNVVYVGTGSACPRGNVSIGDGIYKSTDAGKTWAHVGLTKAGLIARVRIHPTNHDLVYAAVLGNIFGPNAERGIFRSLDGGANWGKVLYIDERTGASDLVMSATNPRILFAGTWQVERKPWTLIDGGEKGGVYRSLDAGDTWERLEKGLPEGKLGRTGVTVSPVRPDRVWVIQEGDEEDKGGLFRSEDGGDTFTKINREHEIRGRAWYYNHVYADPIDENTVYVMNAGFHKSVDGGKNFERVKVPHGDNHDLWINPNNNQIWINSNDGGANVTFNSGNTWSTQLNQPTAEFYRVTVDNQFPYRVYGAQQDNSTISVPSQNPGGLTPQEHWFNAGGMESGHIAVDSRNPNIIFAGNYIGMITRL
ncbi:MAG TPA: glycosyl hydrolase, partial [Acidobacteriota bacterium]|nr:glycosyl hydrolase [Acidobacteriota bacterium]